MIRIFGAFAGGKYDTKIRLDDLARCLEQPGTTVWVDLDSPTTDEVDAVARILNFHPLAVEDCVHYVELPKIDEFEDHAFIVTHGLRLNDKGEVEKVELDCFLGRNFLVTSHLDPSRSVSSLRDRVERGPELLSRGADFLLHSILDVQVDNYMPLIDRFDGEVDRLEDEILERPRHDLLGEILQLRRQVVAIRRSLGPQREVLGRLARHDLPFVSPRCSIYFRDIYDHVVRVHEMLEGVRDLIGALMESYRSQISQRLNEAMHRLTTVSTIFLPMTFVASIYGMNFHHMPELDWRYGYPVALAIMAAIGVGFYSFFRMKRWI